MKRITLWLALSALLALPVSAGTISVAWDAPAATQGVTISGYKVCFGTTAGSYPSCDTVPATSTSTVLAVNDCTTYHVAVKALCSTCAAGFTESDWSTPISGWAAPKITAVAPGVVTQGVATELTLTGTNFAPDATVRVTTGASTVDGTNVSVTGCTSMKATVTLASNLPPTVTVRIGTADAAGKRVAGAASGLFQVAGPVKPGTPGNTRRTESQ